ncbi:HTH-type transcriptional regulator BetI [Paraburkholderia nemoris]|uniref:TetR/AcrR family transcriptional regulator n=1 Tax=Paraburkholderia nemoris TaxID=2793076 RepID=UPI0019096D44|nr:TetR/AcrR family transcriptional regulator [Paraburkholderia nemoris]MBK3739962.1 TetR/AcrR family transcriptional regulator [Paraburkholderia aspalathi]CAE6714208.1 HTH-type transcriptional regulator BetI [Paraburkholderia nemoris]
MSVRKAKVAQPRKSPSQARSASTLEAVLEATIQILLTDGLERLTTTRVARRAGFAVGTVYQYYANKNELIYAIAHRHLDYVTSSVEKACHQLEHGALDDMVAGLVDAFVTAKYERASEVRALYLGWSEIDARELIRDAFRRLERATADMLASTVELETVELSTVAFMLTSTLVGATRSAFEQGASDSLMSALRKQLVILCRAYVISVFDDTSRQDKQLEDISVGKVWAV